eukprot:6079232-Pleurochrysis_carterae.AAC.2
MDPASFTPSFCRLWSPLSTSSQLLARHDTSHGWCSAAQPSGFLNKQGPGIPTTFMLVMASSTYCQPS